MRIAVTSQNRRDITQHAGRCRNFWTFDVRDRIATLALALAFAGTVHGAEPPADVDPASRANTEASTIVAEFQKALSHKLTAALTQGGPLRAIDVCEIEGRRLPHVCRARRAGRSSASARACAIKGDDP